jgi:hypothetical protein
MNQPEQMANTRARRFRPRHALFDDKSRYLDRFGLLLILAVLTVALLSLIDLNETNRQLNARLSSAVASSLVAATLLLSFRASGLAHRWQRIADATVVVGLVGLMVLTFGSLLMNTDYSPVPAPLIMVFFGAVAPLVIVRRLIQHRVVTRATLLGAIAAYLLISVTFFYLFL